MYIIVQAYWCSRRHHVCQVLKMKFLGVTILQGVEFSIFPIDVEWALQQCSATALPVIVVFAITNYADA